MLRLKSVKRVMGLMVVASVVAWGAAPAEAHLFHHRGCGSSGGSWGSSGGSVRLLRKLRLCGLFVWFVRRKLGFLRRKLGWFQRRKLGRFQRRKLGFVL